jgi:hypothetical protein
MWNRAGSQAISEVVPHQTKIRNTESRALSVALVDFVFAAQMPLTAGKTNFHKIWLGITINLALTSPPCCLVLWRFAPRSPLLNRAARQLQLKIESIESAGRPHLPFETDFRTPLPSIRSNLTRIHKAVIPSSLVESISTGSHKLGSRWSVSEMPLKSHRQEPQTQNGRIVAGRENRRLWSCWLCVKT